MQNAGLILAVCLGSVVRVKAVSPVVGGVLMLVPAFMCLFFAVAWSIWPPLGRFIFREALVSSSEELLVGVPGVLAFVLGLAAGIASLLKRHFGLAVTCGGFFLIPAFWVLFTSSLVLSLRSVCSLTGFLISMPLLLTAFALAAIGWTLVATSKKQFS